MQRLFYTGQVIGLFLIPVIIILLPIILGGEAYSADTLANVFSCFLIELILITVYFITHTTKQTVTTKTLGRVTTLTLSWLYIVSILLLLTAGSGEKESYQPVIQLVLSNRGYDHMTAHMINEIIKFSLYGLIGIFGSTALVSAWRHKLLDNPKTKIFIEETLPDSIPLDDVGLGNPDKKS